MGFVTTMENEMRLEDTDDLEPEDLAEWARSVLGSDYANAVEKRINDMTNLEFLSLLSRALDVMVKHGALQVKDGE